MMNKIEIFETNLDEVLIRCFSDGQVQILTLPAEMAWQLMDRLRIHFDNKYRNEWTKALTRKQKTDTL